MADNDLGSSAGGGSRLRWWQETGGGRRSRWWQETPEVKAAPQSVQATTTAGPVAVAQAAPLDIGEELEAEARRRSLAEATGARVVVPFHRAKYLAVLRRRAFLVTLLQVASILMQVAFALLAQTVLSVIAVPLNLLAIFMVWRGYALARASDDHASVLVMTDQGLDLGAIGMIYWHEIAEVRRAGSARYPMVLVIPRDSDAVANRLRAARPRSVKVRHRRRYALGLDRRNTADLPTGAVVYAINHAAAGLSVDDVVGKVNAFRVSRRV